MRRFTSRALGGDKEKKIMYLVLEECEDLSIKTTSIVSPNLLWDQVTFLASLWTIAAGKSQDPKINFFLT